MCETRRGRRWYGCRGLTGAEGVQEGPFLISAPVQRLLSVSILLSIIQWFALGLTPGRCSPPIKYASISQLHYSAPPPPSPVHLFQTPDLPLEYIVRPLVPEHAPELNLQVHAHNINLKQFLSP